MTKYWRNEPSGEWGGEVVQLFAQKVDPKVPLVLPVTGVPLESVAQVPIDIRTGERVYRMVPLSDHDMA